MNKSVLSTCSGPGLGQALRPQRCPNRQGPCCHGACNCVGNHILKKPTRGGGGDYRLCWRGEMGPALHRWPGKATSVSHCHFSPKWLHGYRISLGGDENVVELGTGDGCPSLVNVQNATELHTLNQLVLCYMNFTPIKINTLKRGREKKEPPLKRAFCPGEQHMGRPEARPHSQSCGRPACVSRWPMADGRWPRSRAVSREGAQARRRRKSDVPGGS